MANQQYLGGILAEQKTVMEAVEASNQLAVTKMQEMVNNLLSVSKAIFASAQSVRVGTGNEELYKSSSSSVNISSTGTIKTLTMACTGTVQLNINFTPTSRKDSSTATYVMLGFTIYKNGVSYTSSTNTDYNLNTNHTKGFSIAVSANDVIRIDITTSSGIVGTINNISLAGKLVDGIAG